MNPNFENQQSDYSRRPEYAELSMPEQLEESAIVTKALDALLEKISSPRPTSTGGINRLGTIRYFGDDQSDNESPRPIERIVNIRNMDEPTGDTYIVNINTYFQGMQYQIGTTYTIKYSGAGRENVAATVKTLEATPEDFVAGKAEAYVEHPMVAYDYTSLQNEIDKLNEVHAAQE